MRLFYSSCNNLLFFCCAINADQNRWNVEIPLNMARQSGSGGLTVRFSLQLQAALCLGLHCGTSYELDSWCLDRGLWFSHVTNRRELYRMDLQGKHGNGGNAEKEEHGWLPSYFW
jgi:hypothetical protein